MNPKVAIVSSHDINGGAARAAYRLHRAFVGQGIPSQMHVDHASAGDWTVNSPQSAWDKVARLVRPRLAALITRQMKTSNPVLHSPALFRSAWPARLNRSDTDVVNLHWCNSEMISISDVARITKPLVWTLHDMWAFCGAEHYVDDERFCEGYSRSNRPNNEKGFDLNTWTWKRKRRAWTRPIHIVTPSHWLAEKAAQSRLFQNWPVTVIPNTIDTDQWRPIDRWQARSILHLPPDVPIILFGAIGGTQDPRKGFDLLERAITRTRDQFPNVELVILGQLSSSLSTFQGTTVHYLGHLHDDVSLRLAYSAADVVVIPSRLDNLPNMGLEASACGTPIVAFETGGLQDVVQHGTTGFLARELDPEALAYWLDHVIRDRDFTRKLGAAARLHAEINWSNPVVANCYRELYSDVMDRFWRQSPE